MVIGKLFCKRTFFKLNVNYYTIRGKKYGEFYAAFEKNKIYNYREPLEWELGLMYCSTESEYNDYWLPISKKDYDRYFSKLDEIRDEKIKKIIE